VRPEWLDEQPDLAEREAEVLRLLEATPLPTPRLVAVDATGEVADAPAVLMAALPGQVDWCGSRDEHRLRLMAELLATLHATPLPVGNRVRNYRPAYRTAQLAPPSGTSRRRLWERAFSLYDDPPAAAKPVLIHRDYHPGNVLWSGSRIVGIVDWATSSRGDPAADVGHCRANLTEFGLEAPDTFLDLCRQAGVCADYDPYWDLAAAVDVGHWTDEPDPVLETWLAAAVAALSA
jgi:aminoglycoside phosphotransferase (APT) family kinase protein